MPLGLVLPPPPPMEAPRPWTSLSDSEMEQSTNSPGGVPTLGALPIPPGRPQDIVKNCSTNRSGGPPPDPIGAVSPINIVVTTNSEVGVYSRLTCTLVNKVSLAALFDSVRDGDEGLFDPRVIYDPAVGRFFLTADSCVGFCGNSVDQNQFFAVSKDGLGQSWYPYKIQIRRGETTFCITKTGIWDFPQAGSINGSNPRWLIMATSGDRGGLLTIPKSPTLTGQPVTVPCLQTLTDESNIPLATAPPIVQDDGNIAYFLSAQKAGVIVRIAYDPSSETITRTDPITIPPFSPVGGARQPNGSKVDTSDGRFVAASIQNGTALWNVHSINVGRFARGRLYKVSTTSTEPLFTKDLFTVYGDYIFNLSVATNETHAFVTASRTIPLIPIIGNAAMLIFHGLNSSDSDWAFDLILTSPSQFICNNAPCRWGDYSATQIDPSDNTRAWGFNELVVGTSDVDWLARGALVTAPPRSTRLGAE